jgi:hypothetical protein
VAINLTPWLPEPKQKTANQQCERHPGAKANPKPTGHVENLHRKPGNSMRRHPAWHLIGSNEQIRAFAGWDDKRA